MAGGVSVQKSPLENARRLLSQLVAAWVERGGRGRRPSSAGPMGVEGQLLRKRLGPAWEPGYLTPWAWRGSSNVICLLPPSLAAPNSMALKARSSVRSYQEEIPHNRFFVSRGMSSLMENTNCHELRTPESFSPPRATINLSSPLSCFPFGFN